MFFASVMKEWFSLDVHYVSKNVPNLQRYSSKL